MICPTCGQDAELNAAIVDANIDWEYTWGYTTVDVVGLGVVTVEATKEAETDSYGYVEDGDIHMVVKVGGRFFRKDGSYQSWNGRQWDGKCREVVPEAKQVTIYEFV